MMLGCGYCEKTVHGRRYLYFWHYETRAGRREQIEEYVGPAGSERARQQVSRKTAAYVRRAEADLAAFLRDVRAEMAPR
jgi:hypothetical protein